MAAFQTVTRYIFQNSFLFIKNVVQFPFSGSSRHRLYHSYDALTYPFFGKRYIELSGLLNNDELQVCLSPLKAREHNVSEFELVCISALIKDRQANAVFEIGTYDGRTARSMAMNLKNDEGTVFTLNLPPEAETVNLETHSIDIALASKVVSGQRFIGTAQEKYIQQLWGDSATFDFSPYHKKMDIVFIDGAHSEGYVSNDTMHSIEMIKPEGGLIVWHDAHLYGVKDFFIKWLKQNDYPVYFIRNSTVAVLGVRNGKPYDLLKG
jgi:predicted O-methyltransferase YrrM